MYIRTQSTTPTCVCGISPGEVGAPHYTIELPTPTCVSDIIPVEVSTPPYTTHLSTPPSECGISPDNVSAPHHAINVPTPTCVCGISPGVVSTPYYAIHLPTPTCVCGTWGGECTSLHNPPTHTYLCMWHLGRRVVLKITNIQWGSCIVSSWGYTVINRYPWRYDLQCYQDLKLQQLPDLLICHNLALRQSNGISVVRR